MIICNVSKTFSAKTASPNVLLRCKNIRLTVGTVCSGSLFKPRCPPSPVLGIYSLYFGWNVPVTCLLSSASDASINLSLWFKLCCILTPPFISMHIYCPSFWIISMTVTPLLATVLVYGWPLLQSFPKILWKTVRCQHANNVLPVISCARSISVTPWLIRSSNTFCSFNL